MLRISYIDFKRILAQNEKIMALYQTLGEQKVISASEIIAIEFPVGNE